MSKIANERSDDNAMGGRYARLMPGRRSQADARDTRTAILRRSADIGSVDGLEGVTIGHLAAELGMSKAGVIGHFGSKQDLQLATVAMAVDIFREAVWEPAADATPGLRRLLAVCAAWTAYADNPPFPGGCFLATTSVEFAGRTGSVHDALARALRLWHKTLLNEVAVSINAGELPADTDAEEITFVLEALAAEINPAKRLQGNAHAARLALRAMRRALGQP